jgi:glycosyltransferase involved in cell wall biosynthesis
MHPKSHLDGLGLDHRVLDAWRPLSDADVPDSDVVVATWWETAEWVSALSARKGAKVYFIQGYEIFPGLPVDRVCGTYRLPLHKIVVAKWLADVMRDEYGDAVVDLVPNSVDRSLFFAEERGKQPVPTVGFIYSAALLKGVGAVLQAIERLRRKHSDLRVICFGTRRPVPELQIDAKTEFHHSPRQSELRVLYSHCDVWITASRSEGFNLPAMEAMSCRTPIVSTRTGWPKEAIVSGENGILVDIDDVNGLASGVDWILSLSEEAWRRLSRNAYNTAAAGSWEESTDRFERALFHARQRAARREIAGMPVAPGKETHGNASQ